jgi:triacylglycerol esterase/lipase EstA (alpha/beta hydrolase family)
MKLTRLTIRLLATAAAAAVPVTALASTAHASIPNAGTTILLVHGFNASAVTGGHIDCKDSTMKPWADGLRARGFTVKTVAWYADDTNCDMAVPGIADNTVNTSLDQVAREFTNLVANRFGSTPVGISAHSMGGLVVRRAIDGVEHHHSGFSDNIRVTDVVTSGTPHLGAAITSFCSNPLVTFNECVQATPGSAFLGALANNPQTPGGTDWTLTGSECDLVVSAASATGMGSGTGVRPAVAKRVFAAPAWWLGGCTFVAPTAHDDLVKSTQGLDAIATGLTTSN